MAKSAKPTVQKLMVANKCDLKRLRAVEKTRCEALASERGIHLVETSAKDGTRVDEAFRHIVRQIIRNHPVFEKVRESEAEEMARRAADRKKRPCSVK